MITFKYPACHQDWRRWLLALVLLTLASPLLAAEGTCRIALTSKAEKRDGLFVIDADGTNVKRLTTGGMPLLPAWSPDGKRIAFLDLREEDFDPKYDFAFHWFLYVVDVDAGKAHKITSTPIGLFFQWSPDGRKFVFQSSYEDRRNRGKDGVVSSAIYVMDADGKNQKRLTNIEELNVSPFWSPDGKEIHFTSNEAGQSHAFIMKPDGSGRKRAEGLQPKAKRLISMNGEVHLADADGRSLKRLTSKEEGATDYVLAPDGTRMFYRARSKGEWGLFSVDVDGKNRKRLAQDVGSVISFALSPITK